MIYLAFSLLTDTVLQQGGLRQEGNSYRSMRQRVSHLKQIDEKIESFWNILMCFLLILKQAKEFPLNFILFLTLDLFVSGVFY